MRNIFIFKTNAANIIPWVWVHISISRLSLSNSNIYKHSANVTLVDSIVLKFACNGYQFYFINKLLITYTWSFKPYCIAFAVGYLGLNWIDWCYHNSMVVEMFEWLNDYD